MKHKRKRLLDCILWICLVVILLTGILQIYEKNLGRNITAVPLGDYVKIPPKRLIAIGEPTHGNKETTLIRKELLIKLVEEYNCRAFLLETTFGNSAKINRYLLEDQGTAAECVRHIDPIIYRTKEMEELLRWIHDYNLLVQDDDKIRFYGIDIQREDSSVDFLLEYIRAADPGKYEDYCKVFGRMGPHQKTKTTFNDIMDGMEKNKRKYIERTSERAYMLAKMHVDCIKKSAELRQAMSQRASATSRDQ